MCLKDVPNRTLQEVSQMAFLLFMLFLLSPLITLLAAFLYAVWCATRP